MTFLEAAIEILRTAEDPMHFSEVTRLAVEQNLLSHVGRDPEAAMRSCLNSAVRQGRNGEEPMIARQKPGYYGIRAGAELPPAKPRPAPKKAKESKPKEDEPKPRTSRRKTSKKTTKRTTRRKSEADPPPTETKRRGRAAPRTEPAAAPKAAKAAKAAEPAPPVPAPTAAAGSDVSVEFEAPSGSGLEGVTDVALVMANAVSRLVEERPELKDELDAMQQQPEESGEADRVEDPGAGPRGAHRVRDMAEERSSRRRRRRRRRGKRVDWANTAEGRAASATGADKLLDQVAKSLTDAGARSLHVRQIAETLSSQGVLGGEISEIERAVTSAMLHDISIHGRGSRFAARGDARYQLQTSRLPQGAGAAETAFNEARLTLERETMAQLIGWLQSLGARALESLVRVYLQKEGYQLVSAMPPSRGVGKLVVEDSEDESRALAVVLPKRTTVESKLWDGDPEQHNCGSTLLFAMGEAGDDLDARVIGAAEFATWLARNEFGVQKVEVRVSVLDPTVIESIAGLDT